MMTILPRVWNLLLLTSVLLATACLELASAATPESQSDFESSETAIASEEQLTERISLASINENIEGNLLEDQLHINQQPLSGTETAQPFVEDTIPSSLTPSVEIQISSSDSFNDAPNGLLNGADLNQLQQYSTEGQEDAIEQVTSISQLSDVQPTDWAFQALQSLVERYGVIAGYPDGTYRGNRALTRYEFAAGLNAALDRVNELIAAGLADAVTQEDLTTLQRLQEEFAAELATLRGRVDSLEARAAELEANQFSTTATLLGDAIFALSDIYGNDVEDENDTVLQHRVRLTFDASFSGRDRLRARLLSGNFAPFSQPGNEARFGYAADTDSDIVLDTLNYLFPIGDRARVIVYANAASLDDLAFGNVINPFDLAAARGAVSRFGQRPPIYRVANTRAGASAEFLLSDTLSVQFGYSGGEPDEPTLGNGLFNGNYGLLGQITARNLFGKLDLALTYVNSYTGISETSSGITAGLRTNTGSILAAVDADRPVVANTYGIEANFKISPGFQVGGWAGFSAVRALGLGDADVWNYAATFAFPDLGGEGNLGGILVGVEPRLTGTTPALGAVLGRRDDPDTGLHIEAFYRWALNDYIDITPGVFWITAPNHDDDNSDIIVGTLRTTFRF